MSVVEAAGEGLRLSSSAWRSFRSDVRSGMAVGLDRIIELWCLFVEGVLRCEQWLRDQVVGTTPWESGHQEAPEIKKKRILVLCNAEYQPIVQH